MSEIFSVSTNPHVRSKDTTQTIMRDVLIALAPASIFCIFNFGVQALIRIIVGIAVCMASEAVYEYFMHKKITVMDLSAAVTGLLIALNIPSTLNVGFEIVGCVFATRFNMGYLGLIIGCVLTGAIVGILNGIFYVKLRIPSMIVTTGLALIYESIANYIAGGVEQTLPANIRAFGQMPWDIILALVACAVAYIFLNYTKIGTYTYAIGSDEFVAKNMGINVNKYKVLAFILSGAFLGVMAILTFSYGSSLVAVTGMASMSRNFVPTMGCFFGLAFKKYGMPLPAIIIGEFVINIIFFGFIALGAPTAIQDVITGLALLIIITVTTKATKGEIVK